MIGAQFETFISLKRLKMNSKPNGITGPEFPPEYILTIGDVYNGTSKPQTDVIKKHFLRNGKISHFAATRILKEARKILRTEPTLIEIQSPVKICGDIHGQFVDLIHLFEIAGDPSTTSYLFLGDYVDRGRLGVEVVLYLMAIKINYPKTFFLLRGNHESRAMTEKYTFRNECEDKYPFILLNFYESCMETFDALPLAGLVDQKFLAVHGGLSPHISTLDDIKKINRFREPPPSGPMCDLLWSDPSRNFLEDNPYYDFPPNDRRWISYFYGYRATSIFLGRNNLQTIIRGHEVTFYQKFTMAAIGTTELKWSPIFYCKILESP